MKKNFLYFAIDQNFFYNSDLISSYTMHDSVFRTFNSIIHKIVYEKDDENHAKIIYNTLRKRNVYFEVFDRMVFYDVPFLTKKSSNHLIISYFEDESRFEYSEKLLRLRKILRETIDAHFLGIIPGNFYIANICFFFLFINTLHYLYSNGKNIKGLKKFLYDMIFIKLKKEDEHNKNNQNQEYKKKYSVIEIIEKINYFFEKHGIISKFAYSSITPLYHPSKVYGFDDYNFNVREDYNNISDSSEYLLQNYNFENKKFLSYQNRIKYLKRFLTICFLIGKNLNLLKESSIELKNKNITYYHSTNMKRFIRHLYGFDNKAILDEIHTLNNLFNPNICNRKVIFMRKDFYNFDFSCIFLHDDDLYFSLRENSILNEEHNKRFICMNKNGELIEYCLELYELMREYIE